MLDLFEDIQNTRTRAFCSFMASSRWFAFNLDLLSNILTRVDIGVGAVVGSWLDIAVESNIGSGVGFKVGSDEGTGVGSGVKIGVGATVGFEEGVVVGPYEAIGVRA